MLGISDNLVEFNYENMKITKNSKTKYPVYHIENVNDETFLTGELYGHLELISKKYLISLNHI